LLLSHLLTRASVLFPKIYSYRWQWCRGPITARHNVTKSFSGVRKYRKLAKLSWVAISKSRCPLRPLSLWMYTHRNNRTKDFSHDCFLFSRWHSSTANDLTLSHSTLFILYPPFFIAPVCARRPLNHDALKGTYCSLVLGSRGFRGAAQFCVRADRDRSVILIF